MALRMVSGPASVPVAPTVRSSPVVPRSAEGPDRLFALLDGSRFVMRGQSWRSEVFAVSSAAGKRFVQMALHGNVDYVLTLGIGPQVDRRRVVDALLGWLAHPGPHGSLLEVS